MNVKRNYFKGRSDYTVFYRALRGVDFSARHSQDRTRLAYIENMYRDYEGDDPEAIVSVPGFRPLCQLDGKINSLFEKKSSDGKTSIIAHAGEILYSLTFTEQGIKANRISTLNNTKSAAVNFGNDLFIFDGETLTKISDDNTAHKVGEDGAMPYVPTTFKEGEPYEQRNLLTDVCKEKFTIASSTFVSYGTPDLIYKITDAEALTCAVTGVQPTFMGDEINIPSYATIGKLSYRVEEVCDGAFKGMKNLRTLTVHEGPLRIGKEALRDCAGLEYARLPNSLIEIDSYALSGCARMQSLSLGKDLRKIGEGALDGCISLSYVDYAGSEESFCEIENAQTVSCTVNFNSISRLMNISLPLKTPAKRVISIVINGKDFPLFDEMKNSEDEVCAVVVRITDSADIEGKEATVTLEAIPDRPLAQTTDADLLSSSPCTALEAVLGCTVAEAFDGRIFISGNPKLPNTVIYTARDETGNNNPLYFGSYNYFNDGIASYPVVSLLATADSIAVFKEDDDGCGSIFYHSPMTTDSALVPKIYPVSYIHSGICASGDSISFYDDPVFVTKKGICALDKKSINLQRSVACRSHNVNPELLSLPQKEIRLARWCGYLVVAAEGKMFLADSRATFRHESQDTEYEWFYLSGIGSYTDDSTVYRYTSVKTNGFYLPADPDGIVSDTVYSYFDENGNITFFTVADGKRYRVYPTEQKTGGSFSPATALLSINEQRLFFGTENGYVMTFNNDMRGKNPDGTAARTRILHPAYYGFDRHAPRYAIKTAYDNCSVPHLEKNTVKGSLTLKCGVRGSAKLHCEIGTDNGDWSTVATLPNALLDFSDLDFSTLCFCTTDNTTISIEEKKKAWVEKQISIYSDEYKAPIRIYGMTYRFTVKGNIKNNR